MVVSALVVVGVGVLESVMVSVHVDELLAISSKELIS